MKILLRILTLLFVIALGLFTIVHINLYIDQVNREQQHLKSSVDQSLLIIDNISATHIENSFQIKYGFVFSKSHEPTINEIVLSSTHIKEKNLHLSLSIRTLESDPSKLVALSLSTTEKDPLSLSSNDLIANYFTYSASLLFNKEDTKLAEQWILKELSELPTDQGKAFFSIDNTAMYLTTSKATLNSGVFFHKTLSFSKKRF